MGGAVIRSVPCPLPWSVVQQWAEVHGMNSARSDMLHCCVVEMDRVYLEWWHEKAKADGE